LKENLSLALKFAKIDFKERYVGTSLGQIWYFISPVITIFIYTVIFSDFMKMKLDIVDNTYAYSIYVVAGLLAWLSFSKILSIMTNLIEVKSNLIKKISIPMYVFYLSVFITEFFLFIVSMSFGIIFLLIIDYNISLNFLWLLPIMFLQTIFITSLGIIISLFVPFFKDLRESIPIITQLWFWVTPIIYMADMVADKYPLVLILNPLTYFITLYQDIFLYSKAPSLNDLTIIILITFSTFIISGFLYKKMMSTIKDII
jgi:lipopolysaccharide transport system permease protein